MLPGRSNEGFGVLLFVGEIPIGEIGICLGCVLNMNIKYNFTQRHKDVLTFVIRKKEKGRFFKRPFW